MASLSRLPPRYLQLDRKLRYPVRYSKQLDAMLEKLRPRTQRFALK